MYRIKPKYLLWVLDNLVEGEVKNQVTVDPATAKLAKIALDRMLEI
jgi:quinolinate synthase